MLETLAVILFAGLLAGWLAGLVTGGRGFGTARNIGLALVGAAAAVLIAEWLGIISSDGLLGSAFVALIGAYALLAVVVRVRA